MSSNKIPLFTLGGVNEPSFKITAKPNDVFVSAYSGKILPGHPTFGTPTGLPVGHKNEFYHGGIKVPDKNIFICHKYN